MNWEEISKNPLIIKNYTFLKESGILDFLETIRGENAALDALLQEAYELFKQESVDELIDKTIQFLSDKFIPSSLIIILNEGIMVNKIKVLSFRNMKSCSDRILIDSLGPFETFFRKYTGTTSYLILENEMEETGYLEPFKPYNPEIIVPVHGISGLYGIILFGAKILGEEYNTTEISYIDKLMKFTSIGIQNNIHYEHSVKDPKTGLYNHNFFINRVNEQIARSKRSRRPFTVIVMDIDKFKDFNDTHGHLAGDEAIHTLASVLKKTIREGDILSRFGGEEFTIMLPYAGSTQGLNASERFRKVVEDMEIFYQNESLKITLSLGVSTYNYYEGLDEVALLKRADQALYQSKKEGRNRSTIFKSGLLLKAKEHK